MTMRFMLLNIVSSLTQAHGEKISTRHEVRLRELEEVSRKSGSARLVNGKPAGRVVEREDILRLSDSSELSQWDTVILEKFGDVVARCYA